MTWEPKNKLDDEDVDVSDDDDKDDDKGNSFFLRYHYQHTLYTLYTTGRAHYNFMITNLAYNILLQLYKL